MKNLLNTGRSETVMDSELFVRWGPGVNKGIKGGVGCCRKSLPKFQVPLFPVPIMNPSFQGKRKAKSPVCYLQINLS